MSDIFVISDTHFGHANILTFKDLEGGLIRPSFSNIDEMDEFIIDNWNKTVKPTDKIYHLGDFSFGGKANIAKYANRLNGKKRLVLGNHDYNAKEYIRHFEKVMSWRQLGMFDIPVYMCHFPLMPEAFNYRHRTLGINIHGHIHEKNLEHPSKCHFNACVERINYTPISIETIITETKKSR